MRFKMHPNHTANHPPIQVHMPHNPVHFLRFTYSTDLDLVACFSIYVQCNWFFFPATSYNTKSIEFGMKIIAERRLNVFNHA